MQIPKDLGIALLVAIATACAQAHAATYDLVGSKAFWPDDGWVAIAESEDPVDAGIDDEVDLIGDAANPMAYHYDDGEYLYFRMRLDVDAVTLTGNQTFSDSHLILFDRVDASDPDSLPDYGFVWDSKSQDVQRHGLQMVVADPNLTGPEWQDIGVADIDGDPNNKGVNDINGADPGEPSGYRTTDGYVRAVDQVATGTSFDGFSTYLDVAVSWSYLTTYTGFGQTGQWRVAFATISKQAHNNRTINADVAGGANPISPVSEGWTLIALEVPLPASLWLLLGGLGGLAWQRARAREMMAAGVPARSRGPQRGVPETRMSSM